jgi:hypothetical protein
LFFPGDGVGIDEITPSPEKEATQKFKVPCPRFVGQV